MRTKSTYISTAVAPSRMRQRITWSLSGLLIIILLLLGAACIQLRGVQTAAPAESLSFSEDAVDDHICQTISVQRLIPEQPSMVNGRSLMVLLLQCSLYEEQPPVCQPEQEPVLVVRFNGAASTQPAYHATNNNAYLN